MDVVIPTSMAYVVLEGVVKALRAPDAQYRLTIGRLIVCNPEVSITTQQWLDALVECTQGRDGDKDSVDASILLNITFAVCVLRQTSDTNKTLQPKQLSDTWDLIRHALAAREFSDLRFTVSRGAPGYLSIPLYYDLLGDSSIDQMLRIHVWLSDKIRGRHVFAVHAHQTFTQHWVVSGQIMDKKYKHDEIATSLSFNVYKMSWVSHPSSDGANCAGFHTLWDCGDFASTFAYTPFQVRSITVPTKRLYAVSEESCKTYVRNQSFKISSGILHEPIVGPNRLCATLCFFNSRRGKRFDDPLIMGPMDDCPMNVQLRDPGVHTAATLVEMVHHDRSVVDGRSKNYASDLRESDMMMN